jgi:hypothetical protein
VTYYFILDYYISQLLYILILLDLSYNAVTVFFFTLKFVILSPYFMFYMRVGEYRWLLFIEEGEANISKSSHQKKNLYYFNFFNKYLKLILKFVREDCHNFPCIHSWFLFYFFFLLCFLLSLFLEICVHN